MSKKSCIISDSLLDVNIEYKNKVFQGILFRFRTALFKLKKFPVTKRMALDSFALISNWLTWTRNSLPPSFSQVLSEHPWQSHAWGWGMGENKSQVKSVTPGISCHSHVFNTFFSPNFLL